MLRTIELIGGNLLSKRATVRLPDRVPPPAHFRGEVILQPANCLGCGMCAYVCVSNAITGTQQPESFAWSFEPSQCTFCARCVERCPGQALSMTPDTMKTYTRRGELRVEHVVAFPQCPECGGIVRPAAERLMRMAFDDMVDDARRLLLCERCKRKHIQQNMLVDGVVMAKEK